MNIEEIKTTDLWDMWQKGQNYNSRMNLYDTNDKCYRFFNGNQWEGLQSGGEPPISYNVIKPIVKHHVGTINQNQWGIVYSSDNFEDNETMSLIENMCNLLNKRASQVFEKDSMDYKLRKVSKQSAITREGIIYVDYDEDKNDPKNEIISTVNVCYGNENSSEIQEQPYILIKFRRPVSQVQEYAKLKGVSNDKLDLIVGDNQTLYESGDNAKEEVNDMCDMLLKMYKKDGTVHFDRATKYVTIEEDKDSGLTLYPFAHMVWEEKEGYARGVGIVEFLIPNQIEINKTLMRRAIIVKQTAYPQKVVLKDLIENYKDVNKVGSVLYATGNTIDDVRKVVNYLTPAQMSTDATNLQNEMIQTTRDLNNSSELATGNVNPEDASGRAILAVQQASNMPLDEQTLALKTFIEDLARIYLDMWKTYADNGLNVVVEENGTMTSQPITRELLERLQANVKVDITPESPYDRFAKEKSIENLFMAEKISFEEYVELLDDKSTMPKQKLQQIIEKRKEAQQQIATMEAQANEIMNQSSQVMQNQEDIANIEAMGNQMVETTAM